MKQVAAALVVVVVFLTASFLAAQHDRQTAKRPHIQELAAVQSAQPKAPDPSTYPENRCYRLPEETDGERWQKGLCILREMAALLEREPQVALQMDPSTPLGKRFITMNQELYRATQSGLASDPMGRFARARVRIQNGIFAEEDIRRGIDRLLELAEHKDIPCEVTRITLPLLEQLSAELRKLYSWTGSNVVANTKDTEKRHAQRQVIATFLNNTRAIADPEVSTETLSENVYQKAAFGNIFLSRTAEQALVRYAHTRKQIDKALKKRERENTCRDDLAKQAKQRQITDLACKDKDVCLQTYPGSGNCRKNCCESKAPAGSARAAQFVPPAWCAELPAAAKEPTSGGTTGQNATTQATPPQTEMPPRRSWWNPKTWKPFATISTTTVPRQAQPAPAAEPQPGPDRPKNQPPTGTNAPSFRSAEDASLRALEKADFPTDNETDINENLFYQELGECLNRGDDQQLCLAAARDRARQTKDASDGKRNALLSAFGVQPVKQLNDEEIKDAYYQKRADFIKTYEQYRCDDLYNCTQADICGRTLWIIGPASHCDEWSQYQKDKQTLQELTKERFAASRATRETEAFFREQKTQTPPTPAVTAPTDAEVADLNQKLRAANEAQRPYDSQEDNDANYTLPGKYQTKDDEGGERDAIQRSTAKDDLLSAANDEGSDPKQTTGSDKSTPFERFTFSSPSKDSLCFQSYVRNGNSVSYSWYCKDNPTQQDIQKACNEYRNCFYYSPDGAPVKEGFKYCADNRCFASMKACEVAMGFAKDTCKEAVDQKATKQTPNITCQEGQEPRKYGRSYRCVDINPKPTPETGIAAKTRLKSRNGKPTWKLAESAFGNGVLTEDEAQDLKKEGYSHCAKFWTGIYCYKDQESCEADGGNCIDISKYDLGTEYRRADSDRQYCGNVNTGPFIGDIVCYKDLESCRVFATDCKFLGNSGTDQQRPTKRPPGKAQKPPRAKQPNTPPSQTPPPPSATTTQPTNTQAAAQKRYEKLLAEQQKRWQEAMRKQQEAWKKRFEELKKQYAAYRKKQQEALKKQQEAQKRLQQLSQQKRQALQQKTAARLADKRQNKPVYHLACAISATAQTVAVNEPVAVRWEMQPFYAPAEARLVYQDEKTGAIKTESAPRQGVKVFRFAAPGTYQVLLAAKGRFGGSCADGVRITVAGTTTATTTTASVPVATFVHTGAQNTWFAPVVPATSPTQPTNTTAVATPDVARLYIAPNPIYAGGAVRLYWQGTGRCELSGPQGFVRFLEGTGEKEVTAFEEPLAPGSYPFRLRCGSASDGVVLVVLPKSAAAAKQAPKRLPPQVTEQNLTTNRCPVFTRYLRRGDTGVQVQVLEEFLQRYGYFSGTPDTVFDKSTEQAVKDFQAEHAPAILKPWGHMTPTGYWYKYSRWYANKLVGCVDPDFNPDLPWQ